MEEVDEIFKDLDLYFAAKNGNLDAFTAIIHRVSATQNASFCDILRRLSPAGNTFLHVAAKHGHKHLVAYIASLDPYVKFLKNFSGETALHLVAKAGDKPTAKELLQIGRRLVPSEQLLRAENNRGNTALHEAISNDKICIAEYLIKQDPKLPYYLNKNEESSLYLAAKAGSERLVRSILRLSMDDEHVDGLFITGKSPILAAIEFQSAATKSEEKRILKAMFDVKPGLIQSRDDEGRNPLHYAASLGRLEEARFLLNRCKHNAIQRDKSGSFPIHLASIKGSVKLIRLLLRAFPDSGELLDRDGCSILHLAAKNGRFNLVRSILEDPGLEDYINMQDNEGNTALHLATKHDHPWIVLELAWDKRVDLKVSNVQGKTALDLAEDELDSLKNEKWHSYIAMTILGDPGVRPLSYNISLLLKRKSDQYIKENTNNLLVIAVLIATVTFAAGFTVPGGYESSGKATLWKEKGFQVFMLCDSIAMYTSVAASVALICCPIQSFTIKYYAMVLLGVALAMMPAAFTAGVLVVLPLKLWWLTSAILIMKTAFYLVLSLFFLLIYGPITFTRYRVIRCLLYYIFRWSTYLNKH